MNIRHLFVSSLCWLGFISLSAAETLPALGDGLAPQTLDALWEGFDPRAEPLETEVLHEWEEDGIVLRVVRFRVGIFKGRRAMLAAIYGFPKGASKIPGLVQIHGGGQYADHRAVLTNAKRGYATVSIAWAGRISAPNYRVTSAEVALFWQEATEHANYRVTTDWGALDAYHAPSRYAENRFASVAPAAWSLDAVESPRNNPWFLCTLGARRALTFLERQDEVDGDRLGVYGHSMGGKLTVMTTGSDARVKAAAPSCGGVSDRMNAHPLYRATIGDEVYLNQISCPIIFLSPSNDFHGRINDLQTALTEIRSEHWRITCSPHHNHQDTSEYEVATQIWFDRWLKNGATVPETPNSQLVLNGEAPSPQFLVRPDGVGTIERVDVYYSQHGQIDGERDDFENTKARFWRYAPTVRDGGEWRAKLPLIDVDQPLWVYANVVYPLEGSIAGAGYYYGTYTAEHFNLSSRMAMVLPDALRASGMKATLRPTRDIESFRGAWEKEWFTYRPNEWARSTHKVYDPQWAAPRDASLGLDVRSEDPNMLVIRVDGYGTELELVGGTEWQSVLLGPSDFTNAVGEALLDWKGIKELRLGANDNLRLRQDGVQKRRMMGAAWKGAPPEFRNLRWVDE